MDIANSTKYQFNKRDLIMVSNLDLTPIDNQNALYYKPSVYELAKNIYKFAYTLTGIAYFVIIMAFIAGYKIVGI